MKRAFLSLRGILPLLAAAVVAVGATGARKPEKFRFNPQSNLADYMFMEAASKLQTEEAGASYYLLREAAKLNPDDPEIAGALGRIAIFVPGIDSVQLEEAYQGMRRRYLANPSDIYNAQELANVANEIMHRPADVREVYATLHRLYPRRMEFARPYAMMRARDYTAGDTSAITEALAILSDVEQKVGLEPTIMINRLQVLSYTTDTATIVNEIRRYAASGPSNPTVCYITGQFFDSFGMADSAAVYYDRALAADSTMGDAALARAEQFKARGDSARYDSEVFKVLENQNIEFEPKIEILTSYVKDLYEDKAHRDIIGRMFATMLDIHPGEHELHNLYAAYLAANNRQAAASEQFGYAMDLEPDNPDYPRFAMQTAVAAGDTVQALEYLRTAARRFPSELIFPVQAAALLYQQGHREQALAMLDSVTVTGQEPPRMLSAYYQERGDIMQALGQTDSALIAYDNALKFDPDNVGALNNSAYFMAVAGRNLDLAENYVRRAIQREPLNPTYIDTYAWVLFKKKDYEGAKREIDEALRIYSEPEFADSVSADEMPVPEDAEEVAEELEAPLETASADVYDHAGDIYYMCGDHQQALKFWELALALEPDNQSIKKKVKTKRLDETN